MIALRASNPRSHDLSSCSCRNLAIGVLAILLTGCSDTESNSPGDAPFALTDSAGVQLAVTRWKELPPVVGWTISAEPSVVFGGSGTEPAEFYAIDDAVRLSEGGALLLRYG